MGQNSSIEWCDHTFNPWWGCIRVSPGCEHCYAETFAKRTGHAVWGPAKTTPRRKLSEAYWQQPAKWNAAAEAAGRRARVFCASMADVFEAHPDVVEERARLFGIIEETHALDWLLLTKRPENVMGMVPDHWRDDYFPSNVWIGTSAEDQERWDVRVPILVAIPASVVFVSAEPLLGPIETGDLLELVEWIIIGGESGPGARPHNVEWARSLVRQARAAGAAPFMKQLGAKPWTSAGETRAGAYSPGGVRIGEYVVPGQILHLRDAKGGDPAEWPEDLRVREFPKVPAAA